MKVLVTGSEGMLGTDLMDVLAQVYNVIGIDIDDVDITMPHRAIEKILEINPDVVVHTAAYTDVDGCESNMEKAYLVNAIGTRNVALACQKMDIAMLYISTDFVFDGMKSEPYLEWDKPNPLNVYGASKYAGEQIVSQLLQRHYIIRTAWLYGEHGKNFVKSILGLAKTRDKLQVVNDQVGSPTHTIDVAKGILELIRSESYGTYNLVNKGSVSWHEFANKILELSGMSHIYVEPISSNQLGRPAKRPSYSVLRNLALELTVGDPMRFWVDALEEFMAQKALRGAAHKPQSGI